MNPLPVPNPMKANRKRWSVGAACGLQDDLQGAKESRKPRKSRSLPSVKITGGIFQDIYAVFIPGGVSRKRLQVWQTKFTERGGTILDLATKPRTPCNLVHILGADEAAVSKQVDLNQLKHHEKMRFVEYRWIEECLKDGQLLDLEPFSLLEEVPQTTGLEGVPQTTTLEEVPQTTTLEGVPQTTTLEAVPKTTTLEGVPQKTTLEGVPQTTTLEGVPQTTTLEGVPQTTTLEGVPQTTTLERAPKTTTLEGVPQTTTLEGYTTRPGPLQCSQSGIKLVKENNARDHDEVSALKLMRSDELSQRDLDKDIREDLEAAPSCTREDEHIEEGIPDDEAPDFNKHVAGPLRELSSIYTDVLGDEWRAITYRKTANKLDNLPFKISNAEELKNVLGIGRSMIQKVSEILRSGTIQKLVNLKADPKVQTIQQFASVWGIGPKHARRLYEAGFRSLQDIKGDSSLSKMARIGLKYHDDIALRIPRAEVAEAGSFVQKILEALCPGVWMTIGGSYRRGQSTCGDIDLLITHPDGHSHESLMTRLLRALREVQFLSNGVTPHNEDHSETVDTFMGICKLPQHCHHRRIDIKIYPMRMYAFALVYFTGNDVLNRRVRYYARQKGYKLSDQGLFLRGTNIMEKDVFIPCQTEQDVFEKLGLPYPNPCERNW